MTKRAERLAEYLEGIGWQVFDDTKECKKCGHVSYSSRFTFCGMCSHKLSIKNDGSREATLKDLEEGIKFALKKIG